MTNTGGVLADIWPHQQRGIAIVGYAITIVAGPTLGPIIGGAVTSSYLGWRWTEYLTGIIMMAQFVLDVCFLDESFPPVLLVYKARRLRVAGKNFALHAKVRFQPPHWLLQVCLTLRSKKSGISQSRSFRRNTLSALFKCWGHPFAS